MDMGDAPQHSESLATGEPEKTLVTQKPFAHPVVKPLIIAVIFYIVTGILVRIEPALQIFSTLSGWFVIPILVCVAFYRALTRRNTTTRQPTLETPTEPAETNVKQARLLLTLLATEVPLLVLMAIMYIGNRGSYYGDFSVLVFVFGITLFVPNLMAMLVFGFGYLKGTLKNWKQLSGYNIASFFLFFIQLGLYIRLLLYF